MNWDEVLKRFVHPDPSPRYPGLGKPWALADGRVCATDGKAAIILNKGVIEVEANDGKTADIANIVDCNQGDKLPWIDAIPALEKKPCRLCGGKGTGHKCKECNGTGEHECYCNQCTCDKCEYCKGHGFIRGTGEAKCPDCEGGQIIPDGQEAVWGKHCLGLELVHRFDGIKITSASSPSANHVVFLHFDEGIGVLVPLTKGAP